MLKTPELAMPRTRKITTVCNGKREVWTDYEEAKAYLQKIEDEYIFPILLWMYIRILKAGVKRYMCPIQPMINMCQGNFTPGKKP